MLNLLTSSTKKRIGPDIAVTLSDEGIKNKKRHSAKKASEVLQDLINNKATNRFSKK